MVHTSNVWYNEWAGELAKLLVETTRAEGGLGLAKAGGGGGGAKVFFSNSGTEANEGAIKFARKYAKETWADAQVQDGSASVSWKDSPKTRIVCFTDGFHGRTMGALSATWNAKYQLPFTPLVPGFDLVQFGDAEAAKAAITDDTCAVLIEPIQGEGGVHEASQDFLRLLRAECDRVGAVLIFDEIQVSALPVPVLTGPYPSLPVRSLPYRINVGPLHLPDRHSPGHCHHGKAPRKRLPHRCNHGPRQDSQSYHPWSVTSGHTTTNLTSLLPTGSHGTTFGGSVLATRLGHHVVTRLSAPAFKAHIAAVANHLDARLSALPSYFPSLISSSPIRGRGLIRGIPFNDTSLPADVVNAARLRGVLLLTAGKDAVRLVPSLNVQRAEVDLAVDVIESVLGEIVSQKS